MLDRGVALASLMTHYGDIYSTANFSCHKQTSQHLEFGVWSSKPPCKNFLTIMFCHSGAGLLGHFMRIMNSFLKSQARQQLTLTWSMCADFSIYSPIFQHRDN